VVVGDAEGVAGRGVVGFVAAHVHHPFGVVFVVGLRRWSGAASGEQGHRDGEERSG
jgi:hypothetical protein